MHADSSFEGPWAKVADEDVGIKQHAQYWDATTGEQLPEGLTRKARREELDFMEDWGLLKNGSKFGVLFYH